MSERARLNLRTSDEIIARIEALAHLSGESKNSVANVLLAIQLGGTTCGTTSKNEDMGSNPEESQDASVVTGNEPKNSSGESGTTKKKVSSPPTPPSPSKKKKVPKGTQKEKVSSLGEGRRPTSIDECVDYFKRRRIPNPEPKAQKFFSHYESNGWKVGKNPIKKWGACVTTWICNNSEWQPLGETNREGLSLEAVLVWMQKERPEYYEKFKTVKNINEIDGFYIDEFRGA